MSWWSGMPQKCQRRGQQEGDNQQEKRRSNHGDGACVVYRTCGWVVLKGAKQKEAGGF
jgi:hypothetical protein